MNTTSKSMYIDCPPISVSKDMELITIVSDFYGDYVIVRDKAGIMHKCKIHYSYRNDYFRVDGIRHKLADFSRCRA